MFDPLAESQSCGQGTQEKEQSTRRTINKETTHTYNAYAEPSLEETSAVPWTTPRADGGTKKKGAAARRGTPKHQPQKPSTSCPRKAGRARRQTRPTAEVKKSGGHSPAQGKHSCRPRAGPSDQAYENQGDQGFLQLWLGQPTTYHAEENKENKRKTS